MSIVVPAVRRWISWRRGNDRGSRLQSRARGRTGAIEENEEIPALSHPIESHDAIYKHLIIYPHERRKEKENEPFPLRDCTRHKRDAPYDINSERVLLCQNRDFAVSECATGVVLPVCLCLSDFCVCLYLIDGTQSACLFSSYCRQISSCPVVSPSARYVARQECMCDKRWSRIQTPNDQSILVQIRPFPRRPT